MPGSRRTMPAEGVKQKIMINQSPSIVNKLTRNTSRLEAPKTHSFVGRSEHYYDFSAIPLDIAITPIS